MRHDIYSCSKPLQYFNLRNLTLPHPSTKRTLIILGAFFEAEEFVATLKRLDTSWDTVIYCKTHREVYTYIFTHPAQNLVTEMDASFVCGLLSCCHRFKQLYIYEEGFGSYRKDRFNPAKGIKRFINKRTGVGNHVGFSSFLTGQFLYFPALYKQQMPHYDKELLSFNQPFVPQLTHELPFFLHFFKEYETFQALTNQKIGIYITNHTLNPHIIERLIADKAHFDCIYIKPHPHIKDTKLSTQYGISLIRSNIMLEFLWVLLLANHNQITVYHENSTAVLWFQDKMKCYNMGDPYIEYTIVSDYIKNL